MNARDTLKLKHIRSVVKLWMKNDVLVNNFMYDVEALLKSEYERGKSETIASA